MTKQNFTSCLPSTSWIVGLLVVIFFALSYGTRQWMTKTAASNNTPTEVGISKNITSPASQPQRIVALAPSTVEILYSMGLGDRVVGTSRYTAYPPEALKLPKVGGILNIDYEHLLTLKPDCILLIDSQESLIKKFHELGLRTISVDHSSVEGIIQSFDKISTVCGNKKEAQKIIKSMRAHIKNIKKRANGLPRPRVLLSIDRDANSQQPDQIFAAGNSGFHQELIEIAGGVNAYQGAIAFPRISREKLINLNPDIIIDFIRDEVISHRSDEELINQWSSFSELKAVQNGKIVIIGGNEHLIPGPRFLDTLDRIFKAIHPKESTQVDQ